MFYSLLLTFLHGILVPYCLDFELALSKAGQPWPTFSISLISSAGVSEQPWPPSSHLHPHSLCVSAFSSDRSTPIRTSCRHPRAPYLPQTSDLLLALRPSSNPHRTFLSPSRTRFDSIISILLRPFLNSHGNVSSSICRHSQKLALCDPCPLLITLPHLATPI